MEEKMENKISRFLLERYILDELDERQKTDIKIRLAKDKNLQQRVQQIRNDCEQFYQQLPDFNTLEKNIKKQYKLDFPGKLRSGIHFNFKSVNKLAYASIFSFFIIVFLIYSTVFNNEKSNTDLLLRTKGNNHFSLFIKRDNNIIKISDQQVVCQPHDTLQFIITNKKPVYYAIFGSDRNSNLTKYLPLEDMPQMTGSESGEKIPRSLIIDEKWDGEILYCVHSDIIISTSEVSELISSPESIKNTSTIHITKYILNCK